LRQYAARYPDARASLQTWEARTLAATWRSTADVRNTFPDADPVKVASGKIVHAFNIQHNEHRLVAAIHFNTGMVWVLRIMTHREYSRNAWKDQL
jgi:mRNA interferase HigB